MGEKISVVIPIYNVEPYLRQCLDSVINQTYRNLEIILVDDGSPDNSGAICDEYSALDERVVVIHKKNEGVRAARNDGIDKATGEWVTFVDSDDWCDTDYYERLLQTGSDGDDIICASGHWLEFPSRKSKKITYCEKHFRARKRDEIEDLMVQITTYGIAWDKLYRTDFLRKNRLYYDATSRAFDDFEFNYKAFDHASSISVNTVTAYHYRQVESSISKGYNPQKPGQCYDVIAKMHAYAQSRHLSPSAVQGIHAAAICTVPVSLNCYFFHKSNPASRDETAREIADMKSWPYYHEAIFDRDYRGMNKKQILLRWALRLPWIWPVRLLHSLKEAVAHGIALIP